MSEAQQDIHANVEQLLRTSPDVNHINEITEDELDSAILTTAGKKAPGLDGIQAWIMQEFYQILKPILLRIFNSGLKLQYFASAWKKANIPHQMAFK